MTERDVFATTSWSLVERAANSDARALDTLCRTYWFPLYAFARKSGQNIEASEDMVQGFFADFIARGGAQRADPMKGRFRAWILASFRNHLGHERDRARAEKRGGRHTTIRLDLVDAEKRLQLEPADPRTPESVFDRAWAGALLRETQAALEAEIQGSEQAQLQSALLKTLGGRSDPGIYSELALQFSLSEGALRVASHRLKRRFAEALKSKIRETLGEGERVEDELAALFESLS